MVGDSTVGTDNFGLDFTGVVGDSTIGSDISGVVGLGTLSKNNSMLLNYTTATIPPSELKILLLIFDLMSQY